MGFFQSLTVSNSYFRHKCNCWKELTSQSTAWLGNMEKCFPRKTDHILSLGMSKLCTPLIKQELQS